MATNDRIDVGGALTLGGTLFVDTAPLSDGYYRLFNANAGVSGAFASAPVTVLTNVANQVNLRVGADTPVQFWDGTNFSDNNVVDGGAGVWSAGNTNWTVSNGQFNDQWLSGEGVFAGAAGGTVEVNGAQSFQGLTFNTAGYEMDGPGTLVSPTGGGFSFIETNEDATINTVITGAGGINSTGAGVLTLGGENTYAGATDVAAGTLRLAVDAALPSTTDVTVFNNAVLDVNGTTQTVASLTGLGANSQLQLGANGTFQIDGTASTNFAGVVTGGNASILTQGSTGSLTFTASSASPAMTGTIGAVDDATLTFAAGATTGALIVGAANNGLFITNGGALQDNAVIATQDATATVRLNGSETVGFIANRDAIGAGVGTIDLNGAGVLLTLTGNANALNAGNVSEHAGVIEGAGALTVSGGTHRLLGANTYSGGTSVSGGGSCREVGGNLKAA